MKLLAKCALAAAIMLLGVPSTGRADIIRITETGIVGDPVPGIGYFFGSDVIGHQYKRTFSIDTSMSGSIFDTDGSSYRELSGGSYRHTDSFVSYSLSIDGVTFSSSGVYASFISLQYNANGNDVLIVQSFNQVAPYDGSIVDTTQLAVSIVEHLPPGNGFILPGTYLLASPDNGNSAGQVGQLVSPSDVVHLAQYYLIPSKLVVSVGSVSAVPEPATWSLLILGMGFMGATLRRRRKGTLVTN